MNYFSLLPTRFFHVRRLGYEDGGRPPSVNRNLCRNPSICKNLCKCKVTNNSTKVQCEQDRISELQSTQLHNVPGVFNCRFTNPVGK